MPQYFSMAQNFSSSVSLNVDPRTGQFKPSVPFGEITGNCGLGPHIPISLQYNPQNNENHGFGIGWSFAFASFDVGNKVVNHPNGSSWALGSGQLSDGTYNIKYEKMKNFVFKRSNNGEYSIYSMSGDSVVFDATPKFFGSTSLCLPKRIVTSSGHSVSLTFDQNGRLTAINDGDADKTTLISISYLAQSANLKFYPGKTFEQNFNFTLNLDYLTMVTSTSEELGNITWTFETGLNKDNPQRVQFGSHNTLLAINYPTGMRESVVYNIGTYGLRLPGGGYMPSLKKSTIDYGGGQPPLIKTYTYDKSYNNYLGYNSGINVSSYNDDPLYNSLDKTYSYTVTENTVDASGSIKFSYARTYNKYHLLDEEYYRNYDDSTEQIKTNNYDPVIYNGTAFDLLPAWYQKPLSTSTKTRVKNAGKWDEKILTNTYEYYDKTVPAWYGLLKSETYADNKQIVHLYYLADGKENGCPKDPNAISNTVNGWGSNYQKSIELFDISEIKAPKSIAKVEFDYTSLPLGKRVDQDIGNKQIFMVKEKRLYSREKYVSQKIYTYVTDANNQDFTRVSSDTDNIIKSGDPLLGIGSTSSTNFTYVHNDDSIDNKENIATIKTETGIENTIDVEWRCKYRGLLLSKKDKYNNTKDFTYGVSKAVIKQEYNKLKSKYYTTVVDNYSINENSHFMTHCSEVYLGDPKDNNPLNGHLNTYDGGCRNVQTDIGINNNAVNQKKLNYSTIMQKMYNYCGDIDYTLKIADLPGIEGTSGASLKQEFIYDGLHLKSGYKFPINGSGQIVSSTFNPNTISSTVKNNAFTNYMTEENDIVNNIIKTTTFTDDGSEVHSLVKQLDVYGTLKSIVENITGAEEVKDTTYLSEFTSDFLGRPQSYTLPDGTVLAIEYDTRFIRPLVTKVTYTLLDEKKLTLLECSYNDRGLISQRSLIGRDLKYPHFYSYEYDVAYSRVKKETKPDRKTTINYIYDDNLGGRLTTIQTSDNISQIFSYNRLGQISSITEKSNGNNQVVIMRKLDALGRVVSERYQYSSNLYAITENTYIGSTNYLSSKTDANGLTTYYYYDEFMRLVRLENVHMRTDFSYDKYSRLEVQKSWPILTWNTDNQTGQIDDSKCYSLTKGYDEKTGYITSLIEKSPSSNPTILEMTYRSDGRLTKRTYGPQDPNSIRTRVENYKYDNRKRLIQYNCDGTSFVTDETGNNVKKQDYKYDDINNIKEITTTYIENGVDVNSTTTFNYTNNNPFLVESIVKDNGSPISILYDLAYDRALNDDQGRKFTYDTMERLSSVSDANGSTSFVYDGTNSLRRQLEQDNNIRCFFYDGFKVNAEFTLDAASNKNNKISRIYSLAGFIGQTDPDDIFRFILVDSFDTPIYGEEGSDKLSTATTPFGSSYKPSLTTPSYRGEVYNSALGGYFLGRGYRLYNPRIARFNMPDSYGPHTAAGVNPFAYAHNDPVNYSDPTGHTPQGSNASNKKLLGVVVGIAVVESALIVGSFVLGPLTVGAAIQASVSLAILGGATYEGVKASEDWNSNPSKAATELTFAAMGFFAAYSVGFNAKNFDADHVIPKQVVSSGSKKADDFELAKIKSEESLVQKIIRRRNKIPYFQIPEDKPELFAGLRTATSDDLVEFHEHDIPNGAYKTAEGNVCLQQRDNIDLITGSEFNPVTENPILTPEAANDLNQNFNLPTNRSSDLYVNASMGDDRSRNGSITSGYSTQPGESVFASYDLQQMRSITYLSVRF